MSDETGGIRRQHVLVVFTAAVVGVAVVAVGTIWLNANISATGPSASVAQETVLNPRRPETDQSVRDAPSPSPSSSPTQSAGPPLDPTRESDPYVGRSPHGPEDQETPTAVPPGNDPQRQLRPSAPTASGPPVPSSESDPANPDGAESAPEEPTSDTGTADRPDPEATDPSAPDPRWSDTVDPDLEDSPAPSPDDRPDTDDRRTMPSEPFHQPTPPLRSPDDARPPRVPAGNPSKPPRDPAEPSEPAEPRDPTDPTRPSGSETLADYAAAVTAEYVEYRFTAPEDGSYRFEISFESKEFPDSRYVAVQVLQIRGGRLMPTEAAVQGSNGLITARVGAEKFAAAGQEPPKALPEPADRGPIGTSATRDSGGRSHPIALPSDGQVAEISRQGTADPASPTSAPSTPESSTAGSATPESSVTAESSTPASPAAEPSSVTPTRSPKSDSPASPPPSNRVTMPGHDPEPSSRSETSAEGLRSSAPNPGQSNPGQSNPGQSNPGQANPSQTNPSQANPSQAESSADERQPLGSDLPAARTPQPVSSNSATPSGPTR